MRAKLKKWKSVKRRQLQILVYQHFTENPIFYKSRFYKVVKLLPICFTAFSKFSRGPMEAFFTVDR